MRLRFGVILLVLLVLAAVLYGGLPLRDRPARAFVFQKGDPDRMTPGKSVRTAIGPERRGPDATPDVEAYLLRAYPGDQVPMEATLAAASAWAGLESAGG